jgi:hypothetical protein
MEKAVMWGLESGFFFVWSLCLGVDASSICYKMNILQKNQKSLLQALLLAL